MDVAFRRWIWSRLPLNKPRFTRCAAIALLALLGAQPPLPRIDTSRLSLIGPDIWATTPPPPRQYSIVVDEPGDVGRYLHTLVVRIDADGVALVRIIEMDISQTDHRRTCLLPFSQPRAEPCGL